MIKIFSILALLTILALPGSSSDYLEGGYVGSYTGDAGQYFTDPIFMMKVGGGATSAPSSAYASKPVTPLGSTAGKTTLGRYSASNTPVSKTFSSTPATATTTAATNTGVSGKWVLRLSEGQTIALDLHQSGTRLFGRGSITSAGTTHMALASGTASGNFVTLDVLPESGNELYSLSFDISKLNTPTSYTAYRYGALTGYGTVTASKVA
jgi:hypothetical protein